MPGVVAEALTNLDFRRATAAVWTIVEQANRHIEREHPWELARAERAGDPHAGQRLDGCLSALVAACRCLGERLAPFLPDASARVLAQCTPVGGLLPPAEPLFPHIAV